MALVGTWDLSNADNRYIKPPYILRYYGRDLNVGALKEGGFKCSWLIIHLQHDTQLFMQFRVLTTKTATSLLGHCDVYVSQSIHVSAYVCHSIVFKTTQPDRKQQAIQPQVFRAYHDGSLPKPNTLNLNPKPQTLNLTLNPKPKPYIPKP